MTALLVREPTDPGPAAQLLHVLARLPARLLDSVQPRTSHTALDPILALNHGMRLSLRPIAPVDACKLHQSFHALSAHSRYQRFMGHLADLTPPMLEYLTRVDGEEHVAFVAMRLDLQEREQELVAVGRCIRDEQRTSAEVAITVGDELQGLGVGSELLRMLVAWSHSRGITTLRAHALPSNMAIRRLLARHGRLHERADGTLHLALLEPLLDAA